MPSRGQTQATVKLYFRSEGGQRAPNTLPWEGGGMHMLLGDRGGETRSNPKRSVTFSLGVGGLWRIWMWERCDLAGLGFTGAILVGGKPGTKAERDGHM